MSLQGVYLFVVMSFFKQNKPAILIAMSRIKELNKYAEYIFSILHFIYFVQIQNYKTQRINTASF